MVEMIKILIEKSFRENKYLLYKDKETIEHLSKRSYDRELMRISYESGKLKELNRQIRELIKERQKEIKHLFEVGGILE
jgi:hypothetical protein